MLKLRRFEGTPFEAMDEVQSRTPVRGQPSLGNDHHANLEIGGSNVELHSAGERMPVNTTVQNAGRTFQEQASMMVVPAAWQHHVSSGPEKPFGGARGTGESLPGTA